MAVSPTQSRLFGGRSTPAIRAIAAPFLSLALLVLRVDANHPNDAAPVNHLALVANLFDRRTNFHCLLRLCRPKGRRYTRCLLSLFSTRPPRPLVRNPTSG